MTSNEIASVMRQALEALYLAVRMEPSDSIHECPEMFQEAITSLRAAIASYNQAIAEAEKQEPVAFLTNRRQRLNVEFNATGLTLMPKSVDWKIPLYTTPPPVAEPHKRKPLDMTEIVQLTYDIDEDKPATMAELFRFARAIEAAHGIVGDTNE